MARRRRRNDADTQTGCAVVFVIAVIAAVVNFVVENAVAITVTACIMLAVAAVFVFLNAGAVEEWWSRRMKDAKALKRNEPALNLLLVLAYDNGSLSNAEIEIITRYMSMVHGFVATPEFRKQLKRQAVYTSERQRFITQCLAELEPEEVDRLRLEIRYMKDAHQRRTKEEKARFDDTLYQLGDPRPTTPNPYDMSIV